jgi:hypothetical protein
MTIAPFDRDRGKAGPQGCHRRVVHDPVADRRSGVRNATPLRRMKLCLIPENGWARSDGFFFLHPPPI